MQLQQASFPAHASYRPDIDGLRAVDTPLYVDDNHISPYAAGLLVQDMMERMAVQR